MSIAVCVCVCALVTILMHAIVRSTSNAAAPTSGGDSRGQTWKLIPDNVFSLRFWGFGLFLRTSALLYIFLSPRQRDRQTRLFIVPLRPLLVVLTNNPERS